MLLAQTWLRIKVQSHCLLIFCCDITSIQMMSHWELKSCFASAENIFFHFSQLVRYWQELWLIQIFYQSISLRLCCACDVCVVHVLPACFFNQPSLQRCLIWAMMSTASFFKKFKNQRWDPGHSDVFTISFTYTATAEADSCWKRKFRLSYIILKEEASIFI